MLSGHAAFSPTMVAVIYENTSMDTFVKRHVTICQRSHVTNKTVLSIAIHIIWILFCGKMCKK